MTELHPQPDQPRDFLTDAESARIEAMIARPVGQFYVFYFDDWLPGVDAVLIVLRNGDHVAGPLTPEFGRNATAEANRKLWGDDG